MSSITDTVEGGRKPEELKRIEEGLWDGLDDQRAYRNDDDLPKDEADIHYLTGKLEGFEEALMVFYNVDDVEKVYDKEPE